MTIFEAELWGAWLGLRLVRKLGATRVELRLDSIVVVRCLQGRSDGSVAGAHLIHSIQELMLCDWQVKVKHIYQEVNKRADLLANIGCDLNVSEHVYDVPPSSLGQVLLSNVMGVSTPRSIPL